MCVIGGAAPAAQCRLGVRVGPPPACRPDARVSWRLSACHGDSRLSEPDVRGPRSRGDTRRVAMTLMCRGDAVVCRGDVTGG